MKSDQLLLHAATKFGTPLYVYDEQVIERQYRKLQSAFSTTNVRFHYAIKALSNAAILESMKRLGAGLDAVSINEVYLGLRAGFAASDIIYTPNGVDFDEISQAVETGVLINIDNLAILEKFGQVYGNTIPVCIRLNPHIMAGGNLNISVGHIDSKFGISIHQLRHVLRIVQHYSMQVTGLHMHTGSDIVNPDVFIQGAELLYEAAGNFPELKFLDFGSGFKVSYKSGDVVTPIEEIGRKISASFNAFCEKSGRPLELKFEPGKFLVSESGNLLVKVNVIKQTTSAVFAAVDSGQNHLIRPMFYNAWHQIDNISNPSAPERLYSVVGNICETDTFGFDRIMSETREGDVLAIRNAGAYGFSMSNQYNARFRPAEVLIRGKELHLIRRRETIEDLVATEVAIPEPAQNVNLC